MLYPALPVVIFKKPINTTCFKLPRQFWAFVIAIVWHYEEEIQTNMVNNSTFSHKSCLTNTSAGSRIELINFIGDREWLHIYIVSIVCLYLYCHWWFDFHLHQQSELQPLTSNDHDIWREKSRSWLGTGTTFLRG
jgi:hypothetical protein